MPKQPPSTSAQHRAGDAWFVDDGPFLRALVDVLPSMVWAATIGQGIDYLSHRWVEFTGATAEELLGRGYFGRVHPEDLPELLARSNGARPGNEEVLRFRMRRHDEQWRWMEARHRVLKVDDGTFRAVGATTDVTTQVLAEQEVERRTGLLNQTMELGRLGGFVWQFSPAGEPLAAEPLGALLEILGVTVDDAHAESGLGKALDVTHPDDHDLVRAEMARALDPEIGEYRIDHRILLPRADPPEERWVSVLARMQFDAQRQPRELLGVMQDITARRRDEQAALQAQKSEAMATLAGGVAHDFGNVVGAILNAARVGEAEATAGQPTAETFAEIATAAGRAAQLVERLVGFAKPQEPRREQLDLALLIDEVVALVRVAVPEHIELVFEPASRPVAVPGDGGQLHQVLLNLLTNAAQAIGEDPGTITVVLDELDTELGRGARVQVTDSGRGMSPEVLRRAFDPFFTTRGREGGTGLGLAAVHTIVAAHRGTMQVTSALNHGSTFTIVLPLDADGRVGPPAD